MGLQLSHHLYIRCYSLTLFAQIDRSITIQNAVYLLKSSKRLSSDKAELINTATCSEFWIFLCSDVQVFQRFTFYSHVELPTCKITWKNWNFIYSYTHCKLLCSRASGNNANVKYKYECNNSKVDRCVGVDGRLGSS